MLRFTEERYPTDPNPATVDIKELTRSGVETKLLRFKEER